MLTYSKLWSGTEEVLTGGYCLENSIFFWHVLKGLFFDAYLAGARIRARPNGVPEGDYIGW